jgi:hypothetical protein
MPPGNHEAMVHYQDTIVNKVSPERIYKYIEKPLQDKLKSIFGIKPIAVWGSRDSSGNRVHYEKMQTADDILIVEGNTIKLLGKVAAKTKNQELSRELWKNLKGDSKEGWDLIYFIANPIEIDLPFSHLKKFFDYKPDYSLRGFTSVSKEKLDLFYSNYDDLYSVLQRIKSGEEVQQKPDFLEDSSSEKYSVKDVEDEKPIRKHVQVQWMLMQLGKKSGSKVWIPSGDRKYIRDEYKFDDYEPEFTSGIDINAKYVENIDVVWKEEFRIDAAFEVEHSTGVFPGLLRFSDLKIVAPNSNYPLFVVAPQNVKNIANEQVSRPTFKRKEFEKQVRFLSYEELESTYSFFEKSNKGFSVDVLFDKSEVLG